MERQFERVEPLKRFKQPAGLELELEFELVELIQPIHVVPVLGSPQSQEYWTALSVGLPVLKAHRNYRPPPPSIVSSPPVAQWRADTGRCLATADADGG
ncbi:uncharacterized protein LOC62_02G003392 [Vanrija pseudolonga]|uniref:Uncharacterized protein n=1 Tax=Vanrija pseudolonga TaxID=143232 RepID=A0AAF0Y837_9TREE|nr:hypothetical protein LOC62_02G003392 [Vanrija pseudolonga]